MSARELPVYRWPGSERDAIVERLHTHGLVVVRSHELAAALETDASSALREVFGMPIERVECVPVSPIKGQKSIVDSNRDGRLHVDAHPLLTPNLVAMSCYEQSDEGGISFFADGWHAFDALCSEAPEWAPAQFVSLRKFRYPAQSTFAPTFSRRGGSNVFHHATAPAADDAAGTAIHDFVDRAPKIALKLEPGDVYIIDNHRIVHGRTAFRGHRRLQRTQAWLAESLPTDARIAAGCEAALPWLHDLLGREPLEVRRRLGIHEVKASELEDDASVDDAVLDSLLQRLPRAPRPVLDAVADALGVRPVEACPA